MTYLIALVAGAAFGAGMQYLGTLAVGALLGTWAWTVSGMSAPRLVLPFAAGVTWERSRRAIALSLVVTLAALAGYFAIAHSPIQAGPLEDFFDRVLTQVRTG